MVKGYPTNSDGDRNTVFSLPQSFVQFYETVRRQHPQHITNTLEQRILALDPGETTGWARYDNLTQTIEVSQHMTKDIGQSFDWLARHITSRQLFEASRKFDMVRYEDYRVYSWKSESHAWAGLHTSQWIGAIQACCYIHHTKHSTIMAQAAKGFWTDAKLDHFGLNPVGIKHGRDALRHLLYYILFPNSSSGS